MSLLNISQFVNYIHDDDCENYKKIVYVAIGSAHHMARNINGEYIIDIEFDQQYPMFLRNLHKKHPDYSIYIILIDPLLENPCFTVSNKFTDDKDKILDKSWKKDRIYENIYHNDENIHILEFRDLVNYGQFDNEVYGEKIFDINYQINELIGLSIVYKWFTIIMEYTGRNLNGLAGGYDDMIKRDNDHIFFGLPTRIEGGCYINLEDPTTNFITNMDKGYLTAFTPFSFSEKEVIDIYNKHKILDDEDSKIICKQIDITFQGIIQTYKNNVLSLLRRLMTHKLEKSSGKPGLEIRDHEYSYVANKYKLENFKERINEDINKLVDEIAKISDLEFKYILSFLGKIEFYPLYLMERHKEDPFQMFSGINKILQILYP